MNVVCPTFVTVADCWEDVNTPYGVFFLIIFFEYLLKENRKSVLIKIRILTNEIF